MFQRQAAREIGRQQRSRSRHRRYSPATDTRLNTCSPSDRLARHEHEMRIGQAINLLPERERQAVKLKFFDNQTYDRIADRLGITAEEVGTLLQRALRRLRPHLESVVRP